MNGTILVADTDENTLVSLKQALAVPGVEVFCARTNEECMAATINRSLKLAVISLDFPGMSDESLCNLLRITSNPELPIIGLADADTADHAPGVSAVLFKPVDTETLKETVAEMVDLEGMQESEQAASSEPPVDLQILGEASCDDQDLAIELIQLFFETTNESCERLEKAIAAGDAKEISEASHKCCGASASCGMLELERRMRVIEAMGKENRLDNVQSACDAMLDELNRCRRFLEKELKITIE